MNEPEAPGELPVLALAQMEAICGDLMVFKPGTTQRAIGEMLDRVLANTIVPRLGLCNAALPGESYICRMRDGHRGWHRCVSVVTWEGEVQISRSRDTLEKPRKRKKAGE